MKKNRFNIKILFVISLLCLTTLFPFKQVSAAPYHIDINFSSDNLHLTDNGAILFYEKNVVPGDEFTDLLSVTNNSGVDNVYFAVKDISVDNANFINAIQYQIFDRSNNLVYNTASSVVEQELAVLGVGDSADFTIKMIIKPEAKNSIQYQAVNIQFSFYAFTFEKVPDTGVQQRNLGLSSEEKYTLFIVSAIGLMIFIFIIIERRRNEKNG